MTDEDPQATVSYTVVECPDGEGETFFIEESSLYKVRQQFIHFAAFKAIFI